MAENKRPGTDKRKGRGHPSECLCEKCDELMSEWDLIDDGKGKEEEWETTDQGRLRNLTYRLGNRLANSRTVQATSTRVSELVSSLRGTEDLSRDFSGRESGSYARRSSSSSSSNGQSGTMQVEAPSVQELNFEYWLNDRAEEEEKRRERARNGSYHDIVLVEEEYGFMDMEYSMKSYPEFEHDETKEIELFQKHLKAKGLADAVVGQPIPASLRIDFWSQLVGLKMTPGECFEEYDHKKKFAMSKIGVSPDLAQVPSLGCDLAVVLDDHFPLPLDKKDEDILRFRVQFKRVMCVLARFNAEILQANGIADAVGLLLSFVGEEETFWIVHEMLARSKTDRWYFQLNASQWESVLRSFVLLLRQRYRKLYESLGYMSRNQDKGWKDLASEWFSRLFVNCFSPLCRARMIDLFLLDGVESMYRVGLALVGEMQEVLYDSRNVAQALEEVHKEMAAADFSHLLESKKSKIRFITKSKINKLHELTSNQVGVLGQSLEVFYNPTPSEDSKIVARPTHWLAIYAGLPLNLRTYDPVLVFRGSDHGFLLSNLIRKVKGLVYTIVLVRSSLGEVFGGFGAQEWKLHPKYFGKRSSFVFSLLKVNGPCPTTTSLPSAVSSSAYSPASSSSPACVKPTFSEPTQTKAKLVASGDVYKWKLGNPEMFQLADLDALAFGQSFRLDAELVSGWTRECPTYNSPGFCVNTTFDITDVEVWGLKHPSQDKCK